MKTQTGTKRWRFLRLLPFVAILAVVGLIAAIPAAQAGHNPELDVVFIIDESGSMGGEIAAVDLQVSGQVLDSLCEDGDLRRCGSSIGLGHAVFRHGDPLSPCRS